MAQKYLRASLRWETVVTTRPPIIIPPALALLAKRKRFVGWKWENGENGKLTKVPYRGHTPNRKASSKNPATWCPLDDAMRAYSEGKVDGIGFVLTNSGVTAIDIDDCRAKTTGIIVPWASDLIKHSGSYAEITPSKEGVRIIGLGRGKHLHRKFSVPNTNGVSCELYRRATRIITITGQQLGTATKLAKLDALLDGLFAKLNAAKGKKAKGKRGKGKKPHLDDLIKNGEGGHFGGDRSRAVWFVIHGLLKRGKSTDEIIAVLIDPANGISAHCLDQGNPEQHARRQVEKAQKEQTQVLPPPSAPVTVARAFVESRCLHNGAADALTIRYWCGSWWTWRTTHWVEAQPHTIRSLLYGFTADAIYFDNKGNPAPWSPNRYKIGDLLEALSSLVILPDDFEQPCWIDGRQTGPIVATSNCLLDVASLQLYPHTPLYFGQVSVPFPYDPDAPAPRSGSTFSMSFGRMNRTPPMCSASGLATSSVGGSTCIKFLSWWGQRAGARV